MNFGGRFETVTFARTLAILTLVTSLFILLFLTLFSGWLFKYFLYKEPETNPYSLLVIGVDAVIESTRRADVIMIVLVDHRERKVLVSSVPRDLLLGKNKINSVYAKSGTVGLKQTLSKMLDTNFNGAVTVDYAAFKYLGDELGPVEIHVKEPMKYFDSVQKLYIDFQPGIYQMRGEELLAYIRYRKDSMGDLARIERQKEVLTKLMANARLVSFQKLLSIFQRLQKNIDFEVSRGELIYLFSKLRKGFSMEFVSFPYIIDNSGNVVLDEKKIESYKQVLKTLSSMQRSSALRLVVINGSSDKTRAFLEKQTNLWGKVDVQPILTVWEDVGLAYTKDIVFLLSSDKQTDLKNILKKVYPDKEFEFRFVNDSTTSRSYFDLIDKLSKNRIYPKFPIDAFVVVR
ncbi:LCP family protein [Pseudothermotoga sp.]|uniref:LCP family protein n=1 Tax=Pseudothermotoga sp. TaxID=2033661 RepID=UPI0031F6B975